MHIIILGAGVIGVTTAYYLAKMGIKVTVLEGHAESGSGASYANGAQLCYSCVNPLKSPENDRNNFNPQRIFRNNLFLQARPALEQLIAETGTHFEQQLAGAMRLYFSEKSWQEGQQSCHFKQSLGIETILLTPAECIAREPALAHCHVPLLGGIFYPKDGTGDAHAFTQALTKITQAMGVTYRYQTHIMGYEVEGDRVQAIHTDQDIFHADNYVVALGSASPLLLRNIGVNLAIIPKRGYSITLPLNDSILHYGIGDRGEKLHYTQLGDRLRIAGISESRGYNTTVHAETVAAMIERADKIFPQLSLIQAWQQGQVQAWCGLRPAAADGIPLIGVTHQYRNLFLNTGHSDFGWTLAPISGHLLAEQIRVHC
jgi:D-amino-acid dehydrogenase